ncbi:MAG: endolytic transglycosylase MltG [Chloroflexi bacterium]|nr:endolytic transglycosylase MltG [Chloroflexota bacterium]MDL1884736.1 endolytic transglycosylase MltG [Anaerolineae bacterium CFX8]
MVRFLRVIVLAALALGLFGFLSLGALFVISGGQPVDFVQKSLIRLSLSSRQDDLRRAISDDTTPVRFTVSPGDTPPIIARNLAGQGLIADAALFVDYVRLYDFDRQLQAGTYFLSRALTIPDIANALTDSRNTQFAFRILEGWRLEEIAAAIDANRYFPFSGADFLAAVGPGAAVDPQFASLVGLPPGSSLEGFLYPDTYQLPADVTTAWLRDFLTETFLERVGPQIPVDAAAQGFNLYQIVTLAAIVEREAIHADEQPLIASVYRNRLRAGMRLEADPTVQYPLGAPGSWWPRITAADYSGVFSPYNTYLNDGLPPGPIASPGITAIQAATYPAESDYYYFRADCRSDGYHDFARTFQEHLANGC